LSQKHDMSGMDRRYSQDIGNKQELDFRGGYDCDMEYLSEDNDIIMVDKVKKQNANQFRKLKSKK